MSPDEERLLDEYILNNPGQVSAALTNLVDPQAAMQAQAPVPIRIPVNRIAAFYWDPMRVQILVASLSDGAKPAPVHATCFVLHDRRYYVLSEGNHLVYAARQLGIATVPAIVECTCMLCPEQFVLRYKQNGSCSLWRKVGDGFQHRLVTDIAVGYVTEHLLLMWGVGTEEEPSKKGFQQLTATV